MTKLKEWFLKRIIEKQVIQGYDHDKKIINLYRMIYNACREEFYEDNTVTLNLFLTECFEKSCD